MNDTKAKTIKISVKDESSKPIERVVKQLGKLDKEVKKVSKSAKAMNLGLSRMKTVFTGMIAAMGVRQLTRAADSFQLLKDRITALWGASQNTNETFKKLVQVANETNAPIETIADGFARMSISTKDAGYSVEETITFVKALQQTLRLSGATVMEANSVFLQMSQAFGLSRLQGQELRAVMLGNAEAAKLLANIFNTTKGKLREFGEKGLLSTSKILEGFNKRIEDLNKRAGTLRVTFGQAAVKVMNSFKLEIDQLNTSFAASGKAAKAAEFLGKHMKILLGTITTIVSTGVILKIIAGIKALMLTLGGGAAGATGLAAMWGPAGWLVIGIGAVAAAVSYLVFKEEKLIDKHKELEIVNKSLLLAQKKVDIASAKSLEDRLVKIKRSRGMTKDILPSLITQRDILRSRKKDLKELIALEKARSILKNKPKELAEFQALNTQYKNLRISMRDYLVKLKEMERLKIDQLHSAHKTSVVAHEASIVALDKKYKDLNETLTKTQNIASNKVFQGIQDGAAATVKSIGTVAEQVAGVTNKAFDHLENNLVDFVKKGKFEFRQFAQAIMDDITRMVIRMSIIKPLAGAISGGFGAGTSAGESAAYNYTPNTTQMAAAKGAAFSGGNVIPFASGGVVGSPTTFGMSGGRTGLMGEAGPEAILPLSRGSNGKLGITGSGTVVNVINNSDSSETETKRSKGSDGSEQIDVYIVNKVSEAIGGGQFDRPFQQTYGLNRRGQ